MIFVTNAKTIIKKKILLSFFLLCGENGGLMMPAERVYSRIEIILSLKLFRIYLS